MTHRSVETLPLASIGQRMLAWVLDGLILAMPSLVLILLAADINFTTGKVVVPEWVTIVVAAISAGYQIVMVRWRGQTVGKMALGIKVVHAVDGERVSWWSAGLRGLVPWLVSLLPIGVFAFLLWLGVYFVAALDPHRQGLHDKAAGTLVINSRLAASAAASMAPPPWPPVR